jgi:hypothetical protein
MCLVLQELVQQQSPALPESIGSLQQLRNCMSILQFTIFHCRTLMFTECVFVLQVLEQQQAHSAS